MATQSPTPSAPRRALGKIGIVSGRMDAPRREFIYGPPGAGKSTYAANAQRPIFICGEDGAAELDVARVEFEPGRIVPHNWGEVLSAIDALTAEDSGAQTLVLDGVDQLDYLAQQETLRLNSKWKSIQDPGYGKGEAACLDSCWRVLIRRIEDLRAKRRMNVIMIGHSKVKRFDNPEGASFERYQPSVTDHPQGNVAGFLYGWADIVGFARFEVATDKEGKRDIGVGRGARLLHVHWMPAYTAKCRYRGVPPSLPLAFDELDRAIREGQSPAKLRDEYMRLLTLVDDETRAKATAFIERAGDNADLLSQAIDRLRGKAMLQVEENAATGNG